MGMTSQQSLDAQKVSITEEQKAYAGVLSVGMKFSLGVMIVIFGLYVTAMVESARVPLEKLPDYWSMPVKDFVKQAHLRTGWGWLTDALDGHYLNYIPIIILSSVSCLCYARLIPLLLRKGDWLYAAIAGAEILIVMLAASGILAVGH